MKNLSTVITESSNKKTKIEGVKNSINFISVEDLNKYLESADACLSEEAKEIINWLKVNNKTYISELSTDDDENAIVGFYNKGKKEIESGALKELWDKINVLVQADRVLEIPTLQTKSDFENILSGKLPADYVILKLGTKEGKNNIPKRYSRLIEKIVAQWKGKSSFEYEDLKSIAYEGLVYAMDTYGKKGNKTKSEDESIVNKTFGQYAAYMIRFIILENIKNLSHTVRVPISQQKREKDSKGTNAKSNTVSGDKVVGHNDEGSKTLFDFLGYTDTSLQSVDYEDMDKLWKKAMKVLEEEFNDMTMDIFYSFYGINGHKKLQNKELSEKYNCGPSKITYYCGRVVEFIKKNKKVRDIFSEINDLMHECLKEYDDNNNNEPHYIKIKENTEVEE